MTILDDDGKVMSEEAWNNYPPDPEPPVKRSWWAVVRDWADVAWRFLTKVCGTLFRRAELLATKAQTLAERGALRWLKWINKENSASTCIYLTGAIVFAWGFVLGALIF